MRRLLPLVLAISCFTLSFAPRAVAAEPERTFAIAYDSAEDTVTHLMGLKLAALLRDGSAGAFRADVYPNSQLGSDRELAQSCQAGDIAFVLQTTAPQVNFVPELSVFDIPMLFGNAGQARAVLDKFQPIISDSYEKAGFKILGFGDQGFRVMSANKKIEGVRDFKGIKIRTMENRYHMSFWRAIGANPTPLPWGEVYLSLQQGTIDAQENPLEVIVAGKLYEQQKYIINTNHIFHTVTIIMSKKIYDSLTPEERKIVDECARETVLYARRQSDERSKNREDILNGAGVEILDLPEPVRAAMTESSEATGREIRRAVGDELVDALMSEIKPAKR